MTPCPVCGGEAREQGSVQARDAIRIDAGRVGSTRRDAEAVPLASCATCGLAWQISPPPAAELDVAYRELQDHAYLAEGDNRRRTFERGVRTLMKYTGPTRGSLLDVGCSAGFFLEVALREGWDAWGLDPSLWMSERARERLGPRVFTSSLEDAPLEGRRFDVVTIWDVLEHVLDPQAFMLAAKRALGPSGLLLLNVPACDTLVARTLGPRWPLLLPEHLFYFSRASLRSLLERSGFELLGFHPQVVFFSVGYVLRRLRQHAWPGAAAAARALGTMDRPVPLLIGAVTVVARLLG